MKKMTRILAAALALVLCLGCLAACGGNSAPAATPASSSAPADAPASAPADVTPEYTIKIGFMSPNTHPWTTAANDFAAAVAERTEGKIKVEVYPASTLGNGAELLESTQNGTVEMCIVATMQMGAFVPEVQVLDLPYLLPTTEIAETVLDGEVGDMLLEYVDAAGYKALCWTDNDYRCFSNNVHTLVAPEDLSGIKMRIPETAALVEWLKGLGAIPTIMPATELYTSLQTGVVDGQENGAMLTITDNYYETLKYFTNSNHLYGSSLVLMNDDYWAALPEEYQAIIQEECYNMRDEARALIAEQVSGCIDQIAESGVEVTILTDEQLAKWVESGRTVYDKVDGLNQELVDAFVAAVDELMP